MVFQSYVFSSYRIYYLFFPCILILRFTEDLSSLPSLLTDIFHPLLHLRRLIQSSWSIISCYTKPTGKDIELSQRDFFSAVGFHFTTFPYASRFDLLTVLHVSCLNRSAMCNFPRKGTKEFSEYIILNTFLHNIDYTIVCVNRMRR